MKKVLFVSYGGGHANIARLVYRYLSENTQLELKVLALTVAGDIFKKFDVPYTLLSSYLPLFDDEKTIREYGDKLSRLSFNPDSGMKYEDSVAYMGIGFRDLCNRLGYESAMDSFNQLGRKAFCPVDAMKTILRAENPDLVFLTSGVRVEKAAGLAANELGIPVLRVNDLPFLEKLEYDCTLCVMNEFSAKTIAASGVAKLENIVVTGQPVAEANQALDKAEYEKVKRALETDRYDKVIVHLQQPLPNYDEIRNVEQTLIRIAREHKNYLIVIRPHPNQELLESPHPANVVYDKRLPLKYVLSACDLAITKNSTSGLEAALLGKPLLTVGSENFSQYGIACYVDCVDILEDRICDCLNPDSQLSIRLQKGRAAFSNRENSLDSIQATIIRILSGAGDLLEVNNG